MPNVIHHLGGCPECGRNDACLNVRADHYCVCDVHRVYWPAGSNLFPEWRSETDQRWRANRKLINSYRRVEPLPVDAPIPNRPTSSAVVDMFEWQARKLGYPSFSSVVSEYVEANMPDLPTDPPDTRPVA
jgi:hypothetical protein